MSDAELSAGELSAGELSPAELARRCAEAMWANDDASKGLGMEIRAIGPGTSELSMTVRADMVNGWGIAHGGFIAALADSAFAFACNSRGQVTVAAGFDVTYLEPGRLGDLLVATCAERSLRGRSGIYDVTVRRDDTVIAEFRGRSRALGRAIDL